MWSHERLSITSHEFIYTAMEQVEKTVFISYRRTNAPWALAIFQNLTQHGYDVFFDFNGIASGDFERVILANIKARAHFLVVLTPSSLERCNDPNDWLRREIETALVTQRNIVPLMLEGFDFTTPTIASQLVNKLAMLKRYNALRIPADYFDAAMQRLREQYLSIPLDAVLHLASATARQVASVEQLAASTALPVQQQELTAQEWFEQGFNAADPNEKIRCYSQAIRLNPDYADAYINRGLARSDKGDLEGALQDYDKAIGLQPDDAVVYYNRGNARKAKGDLEGALQDYDKAIGLQPDETMAYYNRGNARKAKGDLEGALQDYDQAIGLNPDYADAYYNRGNARKAKGDLEGALQDYDKAIGLQPDYANAYYNRGLLYETKRHYVAAITDFQRYLDLGAGLRHGDQAATEQRIYDLKKKI